MERVYFFGGDRVFQQVNDALAIGRHIFRAARLEGKVKRADGFHQSLVIVDLHSTESGELSHELSLKVKGDGGRVLAILPWSKLQESVRDELRLADDVLFFPSRDGELAFRIAKQVELLGSSGKVKNEVAFFDLRIDLVAMRAYAGKNPIDLTRRELELLLYLTKKAATAVSREELLASIWRSTTGSSALNNVLNGHFSRLRTKIKEAGLSYQIRSIRNVGFILEE
jgi:DNA-binding response OmpR family regulator